MTFEYRDPETGDKLIARHDFDDDKKPVTVIRTTGLNDGVYVPLDRVEEVVAGIRDAARTAARQTTGHDDTAATPTVIEPQDHPGADLYVRLRKAGEDHDTAQALVYAHARMAVREHVALHGEGPAVGQPAEAHDTEARPPRVQWRVEGYDADEWNPLGSYSRDHRDARQRQAQAQRRYPDMPTRVVRETTTWTVEDER